MERNVSSTKKLLIIFFISCLSFIVLSMQAMEHDIEEGNADKTDMICDNVVEFYFKGNAHTLRNYIKPLLQKRLQENYYIIEQIEKSVSGNEDLSDEVHKLISDALEDIVKEKDEEIERQSKETQLKIKRERIAIGTAIISIITAVCSLAGLIIREVVANIE